MGAEDRQDIELCLDGHPEVFGRLVQRYQAHLVSFLSLRLGDRDRAAEAAQESLVRAYFALPSLKKHESFHPWLLGIARRVVQESARAEDRRRQAALERSRAGPPAPLAADPAIRQAVERLPEPYREAILLRYYGGLSCHDVAATLSLPPGTVTKRLSRAYALLRERLVSSAGLPDGEVNP